MDNDTIANNEDIYGMYHFLQEHPAVGLCSCRLKDKEGNIQNSAKSFPGIGVKLRNIINRKGESFNTSESNQLMEPVYVIGACQMFRREIIDQIGLIDENIFYGPEDADFCLRIAKKGWKIVYLPQYSIIHHWRRVTNKNPFSYLSWKHFCGLCYFYMKHHRLN